MTRPNNRSKEFIIKHRDILVCLFLVMATLAVYWQVHSYDFVELDDNLYFYENRHVQTGFTIEGIIWSFTNTDSGMWIPLVWVSYMAGSQLYGVSPGWHHLTNVFLHLSNILLLFLLLKKLTGSFWKSAFVAALFALHPLHVESVVWITERKDVLSTFFFLLAIWMYSLYIERPRTTNYLLTILCFVFGLMAKPMLVTLPFVLILLDFWPLGRFNFKSFINGTSTKECPLPFHIVLEKIPFLALATLVSTLTFMASQKVGGISSFDVVSLDVRISNAMVSYIKYIMKMIYPSKMVVLYPFRMLPPLEVIGASVLLAGLSWFAIKNIQKRPYLTVGWLWYLVTLVPVIGIVKVGAQAMANRFVYVPFIGLYICVAWGFPELVARFPHRKKCLAILATVLFSILMIVTWKQVQNWENSITLFKHTLKHTSNNYMIHNALGVELYKQGRTEEAIEHYLQALRIKPDYVNAHNDLGNAFGKQGRTEEAIEHYLQALHIKPDYEIALNNLGNAFGKQGRTEEAIEHHLQALRIKPDYVDAHYNLAVALDIQGRTEESIKHYLQALRIKPDFVDAHNNIAVALFRKDNIEGAIAHFQKALRINPDNILAKNNLNKVLIIKQQNQ